MNISSSLSPQNEVARLFQVLGQPVRLRILLVIGESEACVCHLEAFIGLRQAVISQHLSILRKAGLVVTDRVGRNIYYRLAHPAVLQVVQQTALFCGIAPEELHASIASPVFPCPCPRCNPENEKDQDCSSLHVVP